MKRDDPVARPRSRRNPRKPLFLRVAGPDPSEPVGSPVQSDARDRGGFTGPAKPVDKKRKHAPRPDERPSEQTQASGAVDRSLPANGRGRGGNGKTDPKLRGPEHQRRRADPVLVKAYRALGEHLKTGNL